MSLFLFFCSLVFMYFFVPPSHLHSILPTIFSLSIVALQCSENEEEDCIPKRKKLGKNLFYFRKLPIFFIDGTCKMQGPPLPSPPVILLVAVVAGLIFAVQGIGTWWLRPLLRPPAPQLAASAQGPPPPLGQRHVYHSTPQHVDVRTISPKTYAASNRCLAQWRCLRRHFEEHTLKMTTFRIDLHHANFVNVPKRRYFTSYWTFGELIDVFTYELVQGVMVISMCGGTNSVASFHTHALMTC
jgi:hypothetical protein